MVSPMKQTIVPLALVEDMLPNDDISQHSFDNLLQPEQPTRNQPLHRLPTLYEVLNRRTQEPVDLWSFYVYMRDYQNAVDYLDFWIDCITHLRLCKDYVKGLRESLILSEKHKPVSSEKHQSSFSDPNEAVRDSVSSSLLLDALLNEGLLDDTDNKRVSSFLQGNEYIQSSDPRISAIFGPSEEPSEHQIPHKDTYEPLAAPEKVFAGDIQRRSSSSLKEHVNRASTRIVPEQVEKYIANVKNGNITRITLKSSSRNILNTYFQENSPKKLVIPDRIIRKIRHDVELQGRDDPDVFEDAKNYVYSAMERDSFSFFLQKNALLNLNHRSCLIRLVLGLLFFFAAFWISYTLIFINIKPKAIRAVILVPFFLGTYLILTFIYRLDPLMVLLRYSDNPELSMSKMTKRQSFIHNLKEPFVHRLLMKRAAWVLMLATIISAALSVLFGLVPGHRL